MKHNTTGKRLRLLREVLGVNQKEFALALEISQPSLCMYERDVSMPPTEVMLRVAEVGNVSLDWLCGLAEEHELIVHEQHTIYKIFYGDELVYLGKTSKPLEQKLYGHFSSNRIMRRLDAKSVTKIECAKVKTQADLFLYETYYLNKWKPKLNSEEKAKDKLTIELPDVSFQEFEYSRLCQRVEKESDSLTQRQLYLDLERQKQSKRKEIYSDSSLTADEKSRAFGQWVFEVYAAELKQLQRGIFFDPDKTKVLK